MQHPPKLERKRRFSKKLALILTGALVALAAAFVLLLPVIRQAFPSARIAEPTVELRFKTIAESDPATLQSVTISHIEGDSYTLVYQNGTLLLERDDELLAISESYSGSMLKAVTTIAIEDEVAKDESEVKDHLADMGFEPPRATALARYTDGREVLIELGSSVPETTYSYYRWSGDSAIYMCDVGTAETLMMTASRLLPVEQPVLDKTLIDHVTLTLSDGQQLQMRFSTDAAGAASGWLESPYAYPMSADATDRLLTALSSFRLGTPEGAATKETYAEYGFDAPTLIAEVHRQAGAHAIVSEAGELTAEALEEATFRITLGREEGEHFYACLYEGARYNVSRYLCEALIAARAQSVVTRNPADLGSASISAITAQTGTGVLDVRVSRVERVLPNNELETDEDGNKVYDVTVTFNGETGTQEQLDALLARLADMRVSGDLDPDWSAEGMTPRWKLTLTTEGGSTRTIAAYTLDAFSDALVVDGAALHYAYVEALDVALAEWMPSDAD